MAELTTSQLIKIILGIVVVVVVVVGIFLFFRGTVIDFFKNLMGDEEIPDEEFGGAGASGSFEEDEIIEGGEPSRLCEDCEADDDCRRRECREIGKELEISNKRCDFVYRWNKKNNQCITRNN